MHGLCTWVKFELISEVLPNDLFRAKTQDLEEQQPGVEGELRRLLDKPGRVTQLPGRVTQPANTSVRRKRSCCWENRRLCWTLRRSLRDLVNFWSKVFKKT